MSIYIYLLKLSLYNFNSLINYLEKPYAIVVQPIYIYHYSSYALPNPIFNLGVIFVCTIDSKIFYIKIRFGLWHDVNVY